MNTNRIAKAAAALAMVIAGGMSTSAFAGPVNIDVRVGPPAPRYEVVPAARPGYVWTSGYWGWRGNRHYWVPGTYVVERRGYVYSQPQWVNNGGRWHLNRGAWARGGGDRDHDGVPNRFDRDRDGDGRRNGWDRHPNNPNRR